MDRLETNFNNAVDAYIDALLLMWSEYDTIDPIFSKENGFWVNNDRSGVYAYADIFQITLENVILCVKNNVDYQTYNNWSEYSLKSTQLGISAPNLHSWIMGCPRFKLEDLDDFIENQEARNFFQ